MTTLKEQMIPGTVLLVDNTNMKDDIYLTGNPGNQNNISIPQTGETIKILESPKKYSGKHLCKVEYKGKVYYASYSRIKNNTTLINK